MTESTLSESNRKAPCARSCETHSCSLVLITQSPVQNLPKEKTKQKHAPIIGFLLAQSPFFRSFK